MMSRNLQEEAKLDAMQRIWQTRRGLSNIFEDVSQTEDLLTFGHRENPRTVPRVPLFKNATFENSGSCSADSEEVWEQLLEHVESPKDIFVDVPKAPIILDASTIGDIPATYTICAIEPHQFPVIGVYIDRRITTGFKYKVRPLSHFGDTKTTKKCLFNNRALTLKSIGRGYARRFEFEADENKLNSNDNYFYSDNRPEGYAFELEVVSEGDKFTIFDLTGEAQATCEVIKIEGPQIETSHNFTKTGIEKHARVKFTGKVEFYETGVAKLVPVSGKAICLKLRNSGESSIVKISEVVIGSKKYCLKPGIQKIHRRVTVRGNDINDVPTKYSMTGLEHYEIPVVGTYVDPRVIPGFFYKVRPNHRKNPLFGGRSLKLQSIGIGYAKRLTFASDSALDSNNYLWSDNHPDGLGLEPRAIHKGMQFIIRTEERVLGEATVWRADKPQKEEKMEKILTPSGHYAIEKYIHIDVMCHIRLATCGSQENEQLMRVYGLAVARKEPFSQCSKVIRVENVGLDSQLNVLFAQMHSELTFLPKN